MPVITFEFLPDSARVWVFASARPLSPQESAGLLEVVDRYLEQWSAHGLPLTAARDWRDDRFLTVAVDQTQAHASGCSIDGLYRSLRALEREIGTSLLESDAVYFRDASGGIARAARSEFEELASRDAVNRDTAVFDLSVTTLGEWRERFEAPASRTWHRALLS